MAHRFQLDMESDISTFKKYAKTAIKSQFIDKWLKDINNINDNPLLRTYRLIKHDFGMEPYLNEVSNFKYRKSISKLRASSHTLAIEKLRHSKIRPPFEQRLCRNCLLVEDEVHFLTKCDKYHEERVKLYNSLDLNYTSETRNDTELFKHILCSKNRSHLEKLGEYLYSCFKKHESNQNENVNI